MIKLNTRIRLLLLLLMLTLLSGCWSALNVQNVLYATAMGVDYDGENFFLYAQVVNFEKISLPSEAGGALNLSATYVGKGVGATVNTASSDLYKTAQSQVEWGHVSAVVISERALKALDSSITKRIMRFPENRYTSWLYVTQDPIEKIFEASSFFNETTMFTILHNPISTYDQYSYLPPIVMFRYIADVNEKDRIVYLPCIGFNKNQWESSKGPAPQLTITGAYFENYDRETVIIPRNEAQGYRWMDKKMMRTLLVLKKDDKVYGSIAVKLTKKKIKPYLEGGQVKFNIHVAYAGGLHEFVEEMTYEETVEIAKKNIEEEIRAFYLKGLENNMDVYSLMNAFRMKYPEKWRTMTTDGERFILNENSINDIKVDVTIIYSGKYKNRM